MEMENIQHGGSLGRVSPIVYHWNEELESKFVNETDSSSNGSPQGLASKKVYVNSRPGDFELNCWIAIFELLFLKFFSCTPFIVFFFRLPENVFFPSRRIKVNYLLNSVLRRRGIIEGLSLFPDDKILSVVKVANILSRNGVVFSTSCGKPCMKVHSYKQASTEGGGQPMAKIDRELAFTEFGKPASDFFEKEGGAYLQADEDDCVDWMQLSRATADDLARVLIVGMFEPDQPTSGFEKKSLFPAHPTLN